jgi:hypothetical protein
LYFQLDNLPNYFYKRLDFFNLLTYIILMLIETTDNQPDKMLIQRFIAWAAERGLTQRQMAAAARRTPAWASFLVQGKIHRLQFSTRNILKQVLGETHETPHGAGDGEPAQDKP